MPAVINREGLKDPELGRYLRIMQQGIRRVPGHANQKKMPLFTLLARVEKALSDSNRNVFTYDQSVSTGTQGDRNNPDSFTISSYQGGQGPLKLPVPQVKKIFNTAAVMNRRLLTDTYFGNTVFELLIEGMRASTDRRVKLLHYALYAVFMTPTVMVHELGMDFSWMGRYGVKYDWVNAPETIQKSKILNNLAFQAYRWYTGLLEDFDQKVGMSGVTDPKFKRVPSLGEYQDFMVRHPKMEKLATSVAPLAIQINSALVLPSEGKSRAPNKLQI